MEQIATVATSLTTKPEFKTKENFDQLYTLCKDKDLKIARSAILSTMIVLSDIIPQYSVGKHSAKENLSKEVRERRNHDKILLDFTRRFNQFCEASAFNRQNSLKIRCASAKAISTLYQKRPNFNTSEHLSKCVVRLACCSEQRLRTIACESIARVFQNDPNGSNTLQIMTHLAATPTNQISTDMLQTLSTIKLKSHFEPKSKTPKIEDKQLEKELRQADIIDNSSQHQHNQTGILEHLFGTVFRFLKETKSEVHFLAAMNVIHDYVEFINIDIVPAILEALKQKRFSLSSAITSATTAISVCKAATLVVDLRDFYSAVYARCYEALDDRSAILQLLHLFDNISQDMDKSRTASFAKRLMIMTIHAQVPVAAKVIAHIRQLFSKNPGMAAACAFDFEGEGEFNIEVDDPDFCNGPCAKYWELVELSHSYSETLRNYSKEMEGLVSYQTVKESDLQAAREKRDTSPEDVLETVDKFEDRFVRDLKAETATLPATFKVFELP
ncbi:hypothetical protein TRFO_07132 [Tritrichomonas foetus]|uniref:CCAAT-binding factor domain-containing protein n=1 Tax=Tritrichomonas foetus TaxID=1144522 RepID=A0A1J4JXQ3_9EUKA|nr:hypothetical protein TRFO_07132 [Tritrichomonas foetus]|eukprot:OHT02316.1 hypothetical protein TRFO_07132 [Tritrichomonas foetus]